MIKNKFKVVIVEDEPAIARSVKMIVEKLEEFEVVDMVSDGRAGVESVLQHNPHLVITDLRMPFLDGLEMIDQIGERMDPPEFIILSGYADFEYARAAVSRSAIDYLLKPVKPEEIQKVLKNFAGKKNQENLDIRNQAIHKLIFSIPLEKEEELSLVNCKVFFGFVFFGAIIEESFENWDMEAVLPKLKQIEVSELFADHEVFAKHGKHGNEYVYVFINEGSKETDRKKVGNSLFRMTESLGPCVNCVISKEGIGAEGIRSVLKNSSIFTLIHYPYASSELMFDDAGEAEDKEEMSLSRVKEICDRNQGHMDMTRAEGILDACIKSWEKRKMTQLALQNEIRFMIHYINNNKKDVSPIVFDVQEMISGTDTYSALKSNIEYELRKIFHIGDEDHVESNKKIAFMLKEYLDENFNRTINYRKIAESFNYNEKYMAELFKKEYKLTPVKYITCLRMERAKELIKRSPDLLLKTVAQSVGYQDALYFSRVFKKHEGINATEYQMKQAEKK